MNTAADATRLKPATRLFADDARVPAATLAADPRRCLSDHESRHHFFENLARPAPKAGLASPVAPCDRTELRSVA